MAGGPGLKIGLLAPAEPAVAVEAEAGLCKWIRQTEERQILPQTGLATVGGSQAEGSDQ